MVKIRVSNLITRVLDCKLMHGRLEHVKKIAEFSMLKLSLNQKAAKLKFNVILLLQVELKSV